MQKYMNREEAGKILSDYLKPYANKKDVLILALPRGGVPVAYEVARKLKVPLDVFIVRKLGVPSHDELAMGAIAMGNVITFNDEIIRQLNISQPEIDAVIAKEEQELIRREKKYRSNETFPDVTEKTIILVDDGIATGATMRAAIKALRQANPKKLIVAVPVADVDLCQSMEPLVDELVCPLRVNNFYAVGAWYDYFDQTSDEEVRRLLRNTRRY